MIAIGGACTPIVIVELAPDQRAEDAMAEIHSMQETALRVILCSAAALVGLFLLFA